MAGWIGVDLDGTLAVYDDLGTSEIGKPIPAMVERVRGWLAEGHEVRIFTARVGFSSESTDPFDRILDDHFAAQQRSLIEAWCEEHIGVRLAITAVKDFGCIELWDDRAIRVITNTGKRCCEE